VIAFGEAKDVGPRVGVSMSVISIAALAGPPISGAINDKSGGFAAVGYYAGLCRSSAKSSCSVYHSDIIQIPS
jgi:hypothetical protein